MSDDWERYLPQPDPDAIEDARRWWNEENLGLTSTKRQHFVPRMYLEGFANEQGLIRVVDLDYGVQPFDTTLTNAAAQSRYYDLSDEEFGSKRLSTENWLSQVEGAAAPVLESLRERPASITTLAIDQQNDLARFAASQIIRVPAFRQRSEAMTSRAVAWLKDFVKDQVYRENSQRKANRIWAQLDVQPDARWFGGPEDYGSPQLVAAMLTEIQGFANLLMKMPWRVGCVPNDLPLYTSDNPMSRYLTPARIVGDVGMFMTFDYYLPLAPRALLRFERVPDLSKHDKEWPGPRRCLDFSAWYASFARHAVTYNASRYLFGDAPVVPRECAEPCLGRIERATLTDAQQLSGFEPWRKYGYNAPIYRLKV